MPKTSNHSNVEETTQLTPTRGSPGTDIYVYLSVFLSYHFAQADWRIMFNAMLLETRTLRFTASRRLILTASVPPYQVFHPSSPVAHVQACVMHDDRIIEKVSAGHFTYTLAEHPSSLTPTDLPKQQPQSHQQRPPTMLGHPWYEAPSSSHPFPLQSELINQSLITYL